MWKPNFCTAFHCSNFLAKWPALTFSGMPHSALNSHQKCTFLWSPHLDNSSVTLAVSVEWREGRKEKGFLSPQTIMRLFSYAVEWRDLSLSRCFCFSGFELLLCIAFSILSLEGLQQPMALSLCISQFKLHSNRTTFSFHIGAENQTETEIVWCILSREGQ